MDIVSSEVVTSYCSKNNRSTSTLLPMRKKRKRRKEKRKRKRENKEETKIDWVVIINRFPFKCTWIIAHTSGAGLGTIWCTLNANG